MAAILLTWNSLLFTCYHKWRSPWRNHALIW